MNVEARDIELTRRTFQDNTPYIVTPEEIMDLRRAGGSDPRTAERWKSNIERALCFVTARTSAGMLVGAGRVTGDLDHAQLVDLDVHSDYRRQGIGTQIGHMLCNFCLEKEIRYLVVTYDASNPWLAEQYERGGFRHITFAMMHKSSLERLG